jgi:hypothetical protein
LHVGVLGDTATTFYYHGTKGRCVYSIMRNNLQNFSGTRMSSGQMLGPGVYFSELQGSASGHAQASGLYDSCPLFVLEAAGGPGTWKKMEGVSTSLFNEPHHQAQLQTLGRTPHANVVVRGVLMDSSRAGLPSASDANREYFERAQAAYDDIVGARSWGHVDPGLLDVVGPSKGLQASAVQP